MYRIGNFTFEITGIEEDLMPENFRKFKSNEKPVYHYHIETVSNIEPEHSKFIAERPTIKISIENALETRYLYLPNDISIYAKTQETDDTHTEILISKDYVDCLYIDTIFSSLFSLERRMYQHKSYILHSSYIVYHNKAVLFTAPSGTGKSTQADLWKKYRNVEIINGDRTLITEDGEKFYANGWPVCGSSEICHNKTYPLGAIIILDQGETDRIEKLSYFETVKRLIKEITINYHNQDYVSSYFEFIDTLITKVPVAHLTCTISEKAVDCLDDYLKEVMQKNPVF